MRRVFERDINVKAVGPITSECASWQSYMNASQMLPVFQIPDGFQQMDIRERAAKMDYCYGELASKCKMLAFFCTAFKTEVFSKLGYLDERFKKLFTSEQIEELKKERLKTYKDKHGEDAIV